jgi:pilus assembly protein CpaE
VVPEAGVDEIGLIGVDEDFAQRLRSVGGEDRVLVPCSMEAISAGDELPSAIIMGPAVPTASALAATAHLDCTQPDVGVILVAEPDPELLRAALRAGARDVWSPHADSTDINASLATVLVASDKRRQYLARRARPEAPPANGPSANTVIVTLSPKGGAGKTMVSTNLAIGIAKSSNQSVALVDLDMQFGDVATALAIHPEYTIADAGPISENLAALKTKLMPHPSGLHVLCAPTEPVDAEKVTPREVRTMIATLQRDFDTTIIDTAAGLDDYTLAALDLATDLILVSTTDIFAINGTRKLLEVLEVIDLGEPDRHMVLNRANARVNIGRSQIEATLNCRVDVEIPSTRVVPLAMNKGQSLYEAGRVIRRPMLDLLSRFVDPKDQI